MSNTIKIGAMTVLKSALLGVIAHTDDDVLLAPTMGEGLSDGLNEMITIYLKGGFEVQLRVQNAEISRDAVVRMLELT